MRHEGMALGLGGRWLDNRRALPIRRGPGSGADRRPRVSRWVLLCVVCLAASGLVGGVLPGIAQALDTGSVTTGSTSTSGDTSGPTTTPVGTRRSTPTPVGTHPP